MAKSKHSRSVTCTPEELDDIITAPSGGFQMLPSNAYDEVYPGIYVGEEYVVSIFKFYEIYWVHRKKYSINDEKLHENVGVL